MRSHLATCAIAILLPLATLAQQSTQTLTPHQAREGLGRLLGQGGEGEKNGNTAPPKLPPFATTSANSPAIARPTPPSSLLRPARTAPYSSATRSPTSGILRNTFPASPTSTAASEARPSRKCSSASGRTSLIFTPTMCSSSTPPFTSLSPPT